MWRTWTGAGTGETVMAKLGVVLGLTATLTICACSDSSEPTTGASRTLGGVKEGAPIAPGVLDVGILQDATSYQPTKPPPSSGSPAPVALAKDPKEQAAQAKAAATELFGKFAAALAQGEVDGILGLYDAEQVGTLPEHAAELSATFTKLQAMQQALEDKADPELKEQIAGSLGGAAMTEPTIEIADKEAKRVQIAPNLGMLLLGPKRAPPTEPMRLAEREGKWVIDLGDPLTEEEVTEIVAFHSQLQAALDAAIRLVGEAETVDMMQLGVIMAQALQGEFKPAEEEEPEEAPPVQEEAPKKVPLRAGRKPPETDR